MLAEVNAAVAPLRAALEDGDWKRLRATLHVIPTEGSTAVAAETVRVAADALIEECSFSTAFERSFVVRRALHAADASNWLVAALSAARPGSPPLRRLVMLAEMLATTEEGRSRVGRARGVGALVRAWRVDPRCANTPAALAALCAGHIDNVSRFMRAGGVAVACRAADVALSEDLRSLLERTLLLLGLAAVCTPDMRTGSVLLVPFLVKVISTTRTTRHRAALAHAINVVANIAECWRKEGRGFDVTDPDGLAREIADAWADAPRNRNVVSASAWALTGLIRIGKVGTPPAQLDELLGRASNRIASVRALQEALLDLFSSGASASVSCGAKKSTAKSKSPRGVKRASDAIASEERTPPSTPKRARRRLDAEEPAETLTRHAELGSHVLVPVPASAFSVGSRAPTTPQRERRRSKNNSKREAITKGSPARIQDLEGEVEVVAAAKAPKTQRGRTSKASGKDEEYSA